MLDVRRLEIADVVELTPRRFGDDRGFFAETFNRGRLAGVGFDVDWDAGQPVLL